MAEKFISERNLKFLLYEVYDVGSLLQYPRFADHSRQDFDMVFDSAMEIGNNLFKPLYTEMDRNAPRLVDGAVKVHPAVRDILRELGAGGWIAPSTSYTFGGQQLPFMVGLMIPNSVFSAANYSASVYPGLTAGAASLIMTYGTNESQKIYLPKMAAGEWQGTMALTEPQAGSSLSDIATIACPTTYGYYRVTGRKVFVAAGDHDGVDNVVHLMLARIQGAPAGVKGLSLFLVPKKRAGERGELISNDVRLSGLHRKMGYRGCPTVALEFGENGDCRGWLIGPVNQGLACMFMMMSLARLDVGICASGIASAAYYASLQYAQKRVQGRKPACKDPLSPQIPIIQHPDVRRMLLYQKAVVEGSQSLQMHCCRLYDLVLAAGGQDKEEARQFLELLTPVVKSFSAEMGVRACSQALQILGASGYCDEFPVEQYYRDMRVHPIHEGVTAIHAQELLGRKIAMGKGRVARLYYKTVGRTIREALGDPDLKGYAQELEKALGKLEQVTGYLFGLAAQGNVELFLADATLYLEMFGLVTIGWQWLMQAIVARKALRHGEGFFEDIHFYEGKLCTCRYFFVYELPKIESLAISLTNGSSLTVDMKNEYFEDQGFDSSGRFRGKKIRMKERMEER